MWKMLDLFSGLGGASESMVRDPNWEVMRIENNEMLSGVLHTEIMDVLEFRDTLASMIEEGYAPEAPDVVWASPPCVEFSLAYSAPQSIALREGREYNPSMELVDATIDIINMLNPRYWVIENVRGAVKWFESRLGKQRMVINHSIFLWGKFPSFVPGSIDSKYAENGSSRDPLRPNKRAMIPFTISDSLRCAIEQQRTLDDYILVDDDGLPQ